MHTEWAKDPAGFVRRQCPFCGRQFKTPWVAPDALTFQRHVAKSCPHANEDELAVEPASLTCVYCSRSAPRDLFVTPAQRDYVHGVARRLFEEVRFTRLALVQRTLSANPFPTFIPLPPSGRPRDLGEDGPADQMRTLASPCCRARVMLGRQWQGRLHCTQCGASHEDTAEPGGVRQAHPAR